MKYKDNKIKDSNKRKIIQKEELKNLDNFIQKCLDHFKFVEPKKELYEATGNDKNVIISHKSTIPDLVIWNKTFNKNNCFIGANTSVQNEFPRFLFYIKIKKNKKIKNNPIAKSDVKKHTILDNELLENKNNECQKEDIKTEIEESTINNNINVKNEKNYTNNKNKYNTNDSNPNYNNIIKNKIYNEKNKFSNQRSINSNSDLNMNIMSNTKLMNYTMYLIQLYIDKKGWIILTNEQFSGPGTSVDLFQFLQEKVKEQSNLNDFIIIDINKQVKYPGNYFYILLSNIIPKLIHQKQMELIKFNEIMNRQFNYKNPNYYANNLLLKNSNNYNNEQSSGLAHNKNIKNSLNCKTYNETKSSSITNNSDDNNTDKENNNLSNNINFKEKSNIFKNSNNL